jgi:hypothetical protein
MSVLRGEAAKAHWVTLEYTTDDDGIWLACGCGWRRHLGYSPRVEAAAAMAADHRASQPVRS